jgi:hypothetical protein
MNDELIKSSDVIKHYHHMAKHHPQQIQLKVFEGFSHIDFTYASHPLLINEIMRSIR